MTQELQSSPSLTATTRVRKRNGASVAFDEERIRRAISGAFKEEHHVRKDHSLPDELQTIVDELNRAVLRDLYSLLEKGEELDVECIQDAVEMRLMKDGYHTVARRYIVYREEHKKARALRDSEQAKAPTVTYNIVMPNGTHAPLDVRLVRQAIVRACQGFEESCSAQDVIDETLRNLYDGVKHSELHTAMILAARSRIEKDPNYGYVAARLLLDVIYQRVFHIDTLTKDPYSIYRERFSDYLEKGIAADRLTPELRNFDLDKITAAMVPERDRNFAYLGLQAVYDRYLIKDCDTLLETPQYFWMRVAMGLCLNEGEAKEERAIEFYNVLSQFLYTS
ncbi:MAG: ribonucleoside-diphosphate reductase subunit alpha, partial [Chlamydiia bacterium]|nr:ribonucleoside-diphosphate reductase subunit alpha [Chlamydiia bacterium]